MENKTIDPKTTTMSELRELTPREYFEYVKSKGFDLERGLYVEETNRKNLSVEEFKKVTNYAKTKEILKTTTLELPDTPELQDIKKLV